MGAFRVARGATTHSHALRRAGLVQKAEQQVLRRWSDRRRAVVPFLVLPVEERRPGLIAILPQSSGAQGIERQCCNEERKETTR